jgi:hypothetical protein
MKLKTFNKKHNGGQAVITVVLFFVIISLVVISSAVTIVGKRSTSASRLLYSKKSYFVTEAGLEDVTYRLMKGKAYDATESLSLDGFSATTTVAVVSGNQEITTTGNARGGVRKVKTTLINSNGAAFVYGVQSGAGGTSIGNNTSFSGSLYSNGTISGENNMVYGTVISAGPSGRIEELHATGTAYAHTISDCDIDKDAYYQHISGTTVDGISYPGSADQPLLPMPVSDAMVQGWEDYAATNVVSGCSGGNLTISSATTTGPATIPCNLILNANLTLTGPVWVEGNITLGSSDIFVHSSLGADSVALIADKPSDRLNSSKITMTNGAAFTGSGNPLSYVFLVSMNNSAENSGSVIAIDVNNNLNGDLFVYAPHGYIDIKNGSRISGMAGYKIVIKNNAVITYETGLASMLFESGPSGGYSISKWEEIP